MLKCFSVFIYFLVFFPFLNIYLFCFFSFCYNFFSFYLFINNLSFSFLIKIFFSCFSSFFSTIFSFSKLVFSFWQIARLQEFFSLHIVEDYYICHLWMDDGTDGGMDWKASFRHDVLYCIRFHSWFISFAFLVGKKLQCQTQ